MVYLSLDMRDERLRAKLEWKLPQKRLELLHCPRCELTWGDFRYRLVTDHNRIEILHADDGGGEPILGGLQGSGFPTCGLTFQPLPLRIQELYQIKRNERRLTKDEIAEVAAVTGDYANSNVGAYPVLNSQCQLFGFPYLHQDADVRLTTDERPMQFLACFSWYSKAPFAILPDGVQMLFWYDPPSGELLAETYI